MSRVGRRPIELPEGVEVSINKNQVTVNGPKGTLARRINPGIKLEVDGRELRVIRPNESKYYKSLHGLYRTLINNMVQGVTNEFEKKLEIVGVGFRGEMKKDRLVLQLGYSHAIVFVPPEGITIEMEGANLITVRGVDKELVGQVAAKIRSFRPPEPYKGKGVKYVGEYIRRKAGKAAA